MAVYSIASRRKRFNFSLTTKLIIVNLLCYFAGLLVLGIYGESFFLSNIAITPSLILSGSKLWTFLTSMFSHVLFFHIFANMFSLFFIGNFLEKIIGAKRFFWIYIISGLVGGLFFVGSSFIFGNLDASAIGASGAIFGLLGVLAVLVPRSKIYLIAGPLLLILFEAIFSRLLPSSLLPTFTLVVNVLIFAMIFSLFSFNSSLRRFAIPVEMPMWILPIVAIVPLAVISFFVELPIGNSAHLGGLLVGLAYGFYLREKFPNKIRNIGRHFR